MKFRSGIETEIGAIELEISELQARLQKIKDFESKAVALLHLAREIASDKDLVDSLTVEYLVDEVADILDPIDTDKPELEPEQPAKADREPEPQETQIPLPIGTKVRDKFCIKLLGINLGIGTVVEGEEKVPGSGKFWYRCEWEGDARDSRIPNWFCHKELDPISEPLEQNSSTESPKSLSIGTRVKSIYSEMYGTVENVKKAPSGIRAAYQYTVNWDNPPIDPQQTYWDTELIEQPFRQLTINEAIDNNTDESVPPGSLITITNPQTGEKISWVTPNDKLKHFDFCYIVDGEHAGVIGRVTDTFTQDNNLQVWVQVPKTEGEIEPFFIAAQKVLKTNQIADTIYQCSDGTVLLNCSKKNLAVGWQEQFQLWGCYCQVFKVNKFWRVQIKGLSAERIEKLIVLHPSVDTPCPESSLGKPLQPGILCRVIKCDRGWKGQEVTIEKECDIQDDSWWVLLPSGDRKLFRTNQLEPVEQLVTA